MWCGCGVGVRCLASSRVALAGKAFYRFSPIRDGPGQWCEKGSDWLSLIPQALGAHGRPETAAVQKKEKKIQYHYEICDSFFFSQSMTTIYI